MGIRVQDLFKESVLRKKLERCAVMAQSALGDFDLEAVLTEYLGYGEAIKPYVLDSSLFVNQAIDSGKRLILEGAQGTLLDVDHGTYPYVTSSNPISGGACVGIGVELNDLPAAPPPRRRCDSGAPGPCS